MAMLPINLFSARGSADDARRFAVGRFPDAVVVGPPDDWETIALRFSDGRTLTLRHSRDYYAGPDWPKQKAGMQGYFGRYPLGDRERQTMSTIGTFQFSLATDFAPDYDWPADDRLAFLSDLAAQLDGVFFQPGVLRDKRFRVLVSSSGEVDADAEWPLVGTLARTEKFGEAPALAGSEWTAQPPTAERVARRAVALVMLSMRAVLERDFGKSEHIDDNYDKLREWIDETGLASEFEPWEKDAIRKRPGKLDRQAAINAMWRIEGLEVLAWALGKHPLPRYDAMSTVDDVWSALDFLDAGATKELIATARLRSTEELDTVRKQLLGYHWRLREFKWNKPVKMDFRAFAANCWFGSFDPTPFDLIDDDLALRGKRIDEADPDVFGLCQSIAVERHKAANWLCWGPATYSDADVST